MEANTATITSIKTEFGVFEVAEKQGMSDFEREKGLGWLFRSTERFAVYARHWTQLRDCYIKYRFDGDFKKSIEASVVDNRKFLADTQGILSDWGDCGGGIAHWR